MLLAHRQRAPWSPKTSADRAAVLAELQEVLASSHFCNSKRYPALLRYLVQHTLEGDTRQIKERTLGIEVFGRPASYDTNSDTIVRYTASEVRRRLATYYHEHDNSPVQIVLPSGSYVPEFLRSEDETQPQQTLEIETPAQTASLSVADVGPALVEGAPASRFRHLSLSLWAAGVLLLLLTAASTFWAFHAYRVRSSELDQFWLPLASETRPPLIVAGGNIFSDNPYSGTETAARGVEYPFVSMQIASAMARVSGLLQRNGRPVDIQAANATTLSDLRDRPIILIGGYNNDWTMRLAGNLPLRLGSKSSPSIQDAGGGRQWQRDPSQPYSAADDYALIGRYHDATTGSMTVIMAGIGRNGSEAAAEFLTNPRSMQDLQQHLGHPLGSANFEAVLHVRVIQGRTGAPSILSARSW